MTDARNADPDASLSRERRLALVVFAVDRTRYSVALSAARRALPMVAVRAVPGAPAVVLGAINLGGRAVPVVDLRKRLGLVSREWGVGAQLLLVQTPRRLLAIPTDDILGVIEVEAGALTATDAVLPGMHRLSAIAAVGDGLLFIYDVEAFLTPGEERALGQALGEEGQ